jgi:hypothetical protein
MVVEGCAYGWRAGVEREFLSLFFSFLFFSFLFFSFLFFSFLFFSFLFLEDLSRDELLCCAKVPRPGWLAGDFGMRGG